MHWSMVEAAHYKGSRHEVDRKAEMREVFAGGGGRQAGLRLVDAASVGATVYCLVQEAGAQDKSLMIAKTRVLRFGGRTYFSWRLYAEGERDGLPAACPQRILAQLPAPGEGCAGWRRECYEALARAARCKRLKRAAGKPE